MRLSFDERARLKREVDQRRRFLRELDRDDPQAAAVVMRDWGFSTVAIAKHFRRHPSTIRRWLRTP